MGKRSDQRSYQRKSIDDMYAFKKGVWYHFLFGKCKLTWERDTTTHILNA